MNFLLLANPEGHLKATAVSDLQILWAEFEFPTDRLSEEDVESNDCPASIKYEALVLARLFTGFEIDRDNNAKEIAEDVVASFVPPVNRIRRVLLNPPCHFTCSDVSEIQSLLSQSLIEILVRMVPASRLNPYPAKVKEADPVETIFCILILESDAESHEYEPVCEPLWPPTVTDINLLGLLPDNDLQDKEVSETHLEMPYDEYETFNLGLYETCPIAEPSTVMLIDPVDIEFCLFIVLSPALLNENAVVALWQL